MRKYFLIIVLCFSICSVSAQMQKLSFQRPKMGSPFSITVYSEDTVKIKEVIEQVFQRVDMLNAIFSDYSETSEISQLSKSSVNTWVKVSPDLLNMLRIAEKAVQMSDNAFDVTVGNIVKLWRKARKAQQLPPKKSINEALSKTGFDKIDIDTSKSQIRFHTEGVHLDFGGVVKGFAAQEAVRILSENGFPHSLTDAGGDLAMGTKPAEMGQGWQIAISVPNAKNELLPQFLSLKNQAVATSGDMYNFVELNGKRYSHIVNPKTGLGLTHQRNVTIIAPDGALADWLATACSILSIKKALKLVKQFTNTEILILENKKGQIKKWQSEGFSQYFFPN